MPKMKDFLQSDFPRFKQQNKWVIYNLFDAFIDATLIRNRAIDFSVAPTMDSKREIHFDLMNIKFTDLLNLDISSLKVGNASLDNETNVLSKISALPNKSEYSLLFAHLNWLWSLGFSESAIKSTTCGSYGKNVGIVNCKSLAFVESGLWSPQNATGRKPNDFVFMYDVFKQYMNTSVRAGDVALAKKDLERIALAEFPKNSTPMANAFLHYCNPDEHIHIFASDVKRKILEDACAQQHFEFSSNAIRLSNGKIDSETSIAELDSEICHFFDSMNPADYDELMRKYFYKDR